MADFIVIAIIAVIVTAAVVYIRNEKKKGVKCIGCPDGASCSSKGACQGCGGCNGSCHSKSE